MSNSSFFGSDGVSNTEATDFLSLFTQATANLAEVNSLALTVATDKAAAALSAAAAAASELAAATHAINSSADAVATAADRVVTTADVAATALAQLAAEAAQAGAETAQSATETAQSATEAARDLALGYRDAAAASAAQAAASEAAVTPSNFLLKANNLSDLPDPAAALGNLSAAPVTHGHLISDVTDLQTTLDGKAPSAHGHAISDVTGLQDAIDNAGFSFGQKDAITNGTFQINQRGIGEGSASLLASGWVHHVDRWYTYCIEANGLSLQRLYDSSTGDFYLRQTIAGSTDTPGAHRLAQVIPTVEVNRFRGRRVVVEAELRVGSGWLEDCTMYLQTGTGSDQGSVSLESGTWTALANTMGVSVTPALMASWYQFSQEVDIPVSVSEMALKVHFEDGSPAGAWFDIKNVSLREAGTPRIQPSQREELMACLPFYQEVGPLETPFLGVGASASGVGWKVPWKVPMFSTPTVSLKTAFTATNMSSVSLSGPTYESVNLVGSVTAGTAVKLHGGVIAADSEL
ncbi:phage tail fiber repeat family protein [Pyruvatibacter sp.]